MATTLFLLAVLPAFYGLLITGDFSQFMYKPSHSQIRFVLRYRWFLLGGSVLLWTLGLLFHLQAAPVSSWLLLLTGFLIILFSIAGFFMPGYILFRSLNQPDWISTDEANHHLQEEETVIGLEINGDARAYPVDMILRPHMVNDEIGGEAVTMSYCMLCNSAMAFKSAFRDEELSLITPLQWENNLMMYNPSTEHLVQQISGRIVGGRDDGESLQSYPTRIMPWRAWKKLHPDTSVLYHPPQNPFDSFVRKMFRTNIHEPNMVQEAPVFPTITRFDSRLPNKSRVLGVCLGEDCKAYPIDYLFRNPVMNDTLGEQLLLIAYDQKLDVADVFDRQYEGQTLTFRHEIDENGNFLLVDEQTASRWDMTGKAISGPFTGAQLQPYAHFNRVYWFSWFNFFPETRLAA